MFNVQRYTNYCMVLVFNVFKNALSLFYLQKVVLRPDGLCKAGTPLGFAEKIILAVPVPVCAKPCTIRAQRTVRQVRKGNSGSPEPQMFNSKRMQL